ncbi:hypothetical protein FGA12_16605 [Shewanella marisflavi]|uniref:Uncharacterized protein n=1 Tax=Shewanella marisflavi TaxID=260364 RepID=A0ABX5WQ04_9GAMM|nr:hypothetical protein FGA12_16605 [Shewanella marisflavi]
MTFVVRAKNVPYIFWHSLHPCRSDAIVEPTGSVLTASHKGICTSLAGQALNNNEGTTFKHTPNKHTAWGYHPNFTTIIKTYPPKI